VFLAGGAAFVVCLARGGEKHRLYCFVAALFGALFIYSNQYGAAAWLARVAQGLRAVLIPFIPLSVFLLVGHNPSRAIRKLCGAAAIVFILVYAGDQMGELAKGREWRLSSDILALGEWMRFEKNEPLSLRNMPENPTILFIGSENEDFYSRTAALYLSGAEEILYDMRYSGDPDIVIAKEMLPEPDYAERGAFGEWRVWLKEEKRK
jgi:hypothetical protein